MDFIRGFLDRIVLLAAVLAAGCVPSFVAQYRQRLGGRLDQIIADLQPFQQIADRFHGGSLKALIEHHRASPDQTFHAEGAAIQAMVDAETRLRSMVDALNVDLVHQMGYLLANHDPSITRATWEVFQPGFTLSAQSLVLALIIGVVVWLVFLGVWHGIAALWRVASAPPRPAPPRRTPTLR